MSIDFSFQFLKNILCTAINNKSKLCVIIIEPSISKSYLEKIIDLVMGVFLDLDLDPKNYNYEIKCHYIHRHNIEINEINTKIDIINLENYNKEKYEKFDKILYNFYQEINVLITFELKNILNPHYLNLQLKVKNGQVINIFHQFLYEYAQDKTVRKKHILE